MNRLTTSIAAAALAVAALAGGTDSASANGRNDDGARLAAGVIGFAAGVMTGSAISGGVQVVPSRSPRHVQSPSWHDRGSWEREHRYRDRARRAWGQPWSREWHQWCSSTYRSFDPRTGTWSGFDGRLRFCEMPTR